MTEDERAAVCPDCDTASRTWWPEGRGRYHVPPCPWFVVEELVEHIGRLNARVAALEAASQEAN